MARRRRVAPFERQEIVRILSTDETEHTEIAGLVGKVVDADLDMDGRWVCTVQLPRRRHRRHSVMADALESIGAVAPPEPPDPNPVTIRVRVDPESGETTAFDSAGNEIVPDEIDPEQGPELFSDVSVTHPDLHDGERQHGVLVGKAKRPDGSWRYAVLLDEDRVVLPFDQDRVFVRSWTKPGEFLDFRRPRAIDELERSEELSYVAAWNAPRPAFGYDQEVRVLAWAHTEQVAGRVGVVRWEVLHDDLTWAYWVDFEDDPEAEYQSVTVGEDDLEATGNYGEGYNAPPDWLAPAGAQAAPVTRRRRVAPFKRREIVRILPTEETEHRQIAGLTGCVIDAGLDMDGQWACGVMIPRRRRMHYSVMADALESTGEMAPPEPPGPHEATVGVRVDPESGRTTAFDSAGDELLPQRVDDEDGPELFSNVSVTHPDLHDGEDQYGVIVGKARRPDGWWRYAVLLDEDRVVLPFDEDWVFVRSWTEPGEFLDFLRPGGIDELERSEELPYLAAWNAPRPAFGYDQEVRVLARPHTAPVLGRVGVVRWEVLDDDLTWAYWVDLEDDPDAKNQPVAEDDLEATGNYGEGYNPPPEWLRPAEM